MTVVSRKVMKQYREKGFLASFIQVTRVMCRTKIFFCEMIMIADLARNDNECKYILKKIIISHSQSKITYHYIREREWFFCPTVHIPMILANMTYICSVMVHSFLFTELHIFFKFCSVDKFFFTI